MAELEDFIVEVREADHEYVGKELVATRNSSASHYGQIVILSPSGQPIGPGDKLPGRYGVPVNIGWLSVLYKPGYKPLSEEERMLWNAGYCLTPSPVDSYSGCPQGKIHTKETWEQLGISKDKYLSHKRYYDDALKNDR